MNNKKRNLAITVLSFSIVTFIVSTVNNVLWFGFAHQVFKGQTMVYEKGLVMATINAMRILGIPLGVFLVVFGIMQSIFSAQDNNKRCKLSLASGIISAISGVGSMSIMFTWVALAGTLISIILSSIIIYKNTKK